jgi:hypothetical protein
MAEGRRARFLREPLLHFAAAGAALFLVDRLWTGWDADRILVTPEIERSLTASREEILLRPLSLEEREKLVSDYIDEEVLLREAYRQGLDRGDPRIRRWLLDKVEFLIAEEPGEASPDELDRFFLAHAEKYRSPRTASFDHVFLEKNAAAAEALLARLRSGEDFRGRGDEFWLGQSLNRFSELELTTTFGPEFTARLLALPAGEWAGPIPSSRGMHLVRVREQHAPEQRSREEVDWELREDWARAKREESRERRLRELRTRYRIER